MPDPLSRVPGIWRPHLAVALNGKRGRLSAMRPGPGLAWNGDDGVGYFGGVHLWLADSASRAQLQPVILLDDPTGATTGCLAAFCRELYGAPLAYAMPDVGAWSIWLRADGDAGWSQVGIGPTEAAAWKAAILAHPSLSELR